MRGIRLSHGVSFVEYDGVTVRVNADGTCDLSPIQLPALEWDLRTEPPETWNYLCDRDIDEQTRMRIEAVVRRFQSVVGE